MKLTKRKKWLLTAMVIIGVWFGVCWVLPRKVCRSVFFCGILEIKRDACPGMVCYGYFGQAYCIPGLNISIWR